MNITFENPEKVSGLMTITVEEADYQEKVRKTLNEYRRKANIPGFRPGQAPLSLIKRQAGAQVKVDTINKLVGEKLYEYIKDNKINMLGEPMPHLGQEPVDLDAPAPYTLQFDIAVAPEFDLKLDKRNKIAYYDIKVDEKMIDQQIADGQFAETPLSFSDVEAIREVFTTKLIAIHHQRIAYPDLKNKA